MEALHYLLVRDSIHGNLDDVIELDVDSFVIHGKKIRILPGKKPGELPWITLDVDVVIDATGKYLWRNELDRHIQAGAKRVIVSRTPKDEIDRIVIHGVNDNAIQQSDKIISASIKS